MDVKGDNNLETDSLVISWSLNKRKRTDSTSSSDFDIGTDEEQVHESDQLNNMGQFCDTNSTGDDPEVSNHTESLTGGLEEDDGQALGQGNVLRCRSKRSDRHAALNYLEDLAVSILEQVNESEVKETRRLQSLLTKDKPVDDRNYKEPEAGLVLQMFDCARGIDKTVRFPHSSYRTANRPSADNLARYLAVMQHLHQALSDDVMITKRDIFYRDVNLFQKQTTSDAIIDTLVASAGLRRADFNVSAAAKGLIITTAFEFELQDGIRLPLNSPQGTLVPLTTSITSIKLSQEPRWVLIVEKEAVFQTLCSEAFHRQKVVGPGIIVTGKGYPDFNTLHLLRLLADTFPQAPFYALVDADPHGIDILSVYTFGSVTFQYAKETEGLALGDRLQWIGVKASEWSQHDIPFDSFLPLSERDTSFALSMLRTQPDMPEEWRREMAYFLHMRCKAEIQSIYQAPPEQGSAQGTTDDSGDLIDTAISGASRESAMYHSGFLTNYLLRKMESMASKLPGQGESDIDKT